MVTRAFYSFVNFLNLNFFECVCKEILTEDFLGEQNLLSSSDESGTDTADQMNGPSDPALFIGMRSRDHKVSIESFSANTEWHTKPNCTEIRWGPSQLFMSFIRY